MQRAGSVELRSLIELGFAQQTQTQTQTARIVGAAPNIRSQRVFHFPYAISSLSNHMNGAWGVS